MDYPDWLDLDLWNEFLEFRKEIRKKVTPTAEKRLIKKLERLIEYESQEDIISRSIERGWTGLFGDTHAQSNRALSAPERVRRAIDQQRGFRVINGTG